MVIKQKLSKARNNSVLEMNTNVSEGLCPGLTDLRTDRSIAMGGLFRHFILFPLSIMATLAYHLCL